MQATNSYRLKTTLSPKAKPRVTRASIDAAVRRVRPYAGGHAGRGITVCAGGYLYFTNAWVLIRMLRKLGCMLPVQFWYYGEEMDRRMRKLVEPYGVECVDAQKVAAERGVKLSAGWPLKPFSILHPPFEKCWRWMRTISRSATRSIFLRNRLTGRRARSSGRM